MADASAADTTYPLNFMLGEGAIGPAVPIATHQITERAVAELVKDLQGDVYYDAIDPTAIPTKCVDGRGRQDGRQQLGANAAGGTFSLVVADALTAHTYRLAGEAVPEHARRLYGELLKLRQPIGGHNDDQASGCNCGCGAEDKLDNNQSGQPSILDYIGRRGNDLRAVLLANCDMEVSDDLHDQIIRGARKLRDEGYATCGADLSLAYTHTAGPEAVETLTGSHHEVAIVLNMRTGTTLNRQKVRLAFGNDYQVFNLDVPALEKASGLISLSAAEAHQRFVAALYYNLATAAVLADPSLRVVVRH